MVSLPSVDRMYLIVLKLKLTPLEILHQPRHFPLWPFFHTTHFQHWMEVGFFTFSPKHSLFFPNYLDYGYVHSSKHFIT